MRSIGLQVPRDNQTVFQFDNELKNNEMIALVLPDDSISSPGSIVAIEGYGAKGGRFKIQVC